MGIHVGIDTNRSSSWVGTFNPKDEKDMDEYEIVKAIVRNVNSNTKQRFRVEKRGRKPKYKVDGKSYQWGGNIVGGINNATVWDVYIYRRNYDYYNGRRFG